MDKNKKLIVILFILALFIVRSTFSLFRDSLAGNSTMVSADWNVTLEQTGVNNNLLVVPGQSVATYTINVKNLSDVDATYDVVLTNVPSGIEASVDGTNFTRVSNGTITINDVGTILYNDKDHMDSKTITFRGVSDATPVSNQEVTINVIVKQLINNQ